MRMREEKGPSNVITEMQSLKNATKRILLLLFVLLLFTYSVLFFSRPLCPTAAVASSKYTFDGGALILLEKCPKKLLIQKIKKINGIFVETAI